jgi:hypothetical protein
LHCLEISKPQKNVPCIKWKLLLQLSVVKIHELKFPEQLFGKGKHELKFPEQKIIAGEEK